MIKDNLDPLENLYSGLSPNTHTLLVHVLYTNAELSYGSFYQEMFQILRSSNIKTVLDVGGCTGEFTKVMIENIPSIKKSIIVEPLSSNYHFIKYRFCYESRIEVVKKCVFYCEEKTLGIYRNGNFGGAQVIFTKDDSIEHSEIVDMCSLEDFPICDFIKLDVEGSEWRIIENSTNLDKFKFIQIEFHDLPEWHSAYNWHSFIENYLPNHQILIDGKNCEREWGGSWFEQVLLKRKT